MKISQIMTREALVIQENTTVERMVELFAKHQISGAPVIDEDGELVGVVSLSDLSRNKSKINSSEYYKAPTWTQANQSVDGQEQKLVGDIMTQLIICAEEDEPIEVAADLIVNHGIHRVIVTRQEKVVGVVSSGDLVKEFRNRLRSARQLQ